ncbi:MAG: SHOCT domain-containing protein [Burkholderiaceae bacterium]
MYYEGGMFMGGMHLLWWVFWVALIVVIVYAFRGGRSGDTEAARETPQQVLKRRLASGEITPGEYEECKALLDRDDSRKA